MTNTPTEDHHHTDEPIAWKQAADDVFVATHDGEFAGFVAVDGHRHLAHDRHGQQIGDFPSLATALAALEEGSPAKGRRPGAPRTSRSRRMTRRVHA